MEWTEPSPVDRRNGRGLFARVPRLRAVVDSVLEGQLGRAIFDDAGRPTVGRLELGCYSIFGGDASSRAAREAVAGVSVPRELVFPDDDAWRALILEVHEARAVDRSMQAFSGRSLDVRALRALVASSGLDVRRMDVALASQLDEAIEPHALQVFAGAEDFVARGVGYAICRHGRVASAATSYAVSRGAIELAISTRAEHRGQGLAAVSAAALIVDCLERGVLPHWNASNPVSKRLAVRLGFEPDGICEILIVT